jgi:hypothetical protein
MQKKRDAKRRKRVLAKMDVSMPPAPGVPGIYRVVPLSPDGLAKMDAWIAEITLISSPSPASSEACKERT